MSRSRFLIPEGKFKSLAVVPVGAVTSVLVAVPAYAEPRVEVTARGCEGAAYEIEQRSARVVAERSTPGLRASVTLEREGKNVRVTVAAHEQGVARGNTALVVSSCEEAVDVAVVVLSLAFSSEVTDGAPGAVPEANSDAPPHAELPSPPRRAMVTSFSPPSPGRDVQRAEARSPDLSRSTQLALAGGVDVGTLPTATALVAGSVTHFWSALGIRGALRYGFPSEHERVETTLQQSVRHDFAELGLGACYGVGADVRLAACAGSELGVVRAARRLEVEGATDVDEDEVVPRVSAMLAAVFSARTGRVRPELELSGSALVLGRRTGTGPVAFRAAAGAALDF